MAGAVCVIAWGLWCLLRAPVLAARYQRELGEQKDDPDWRLMSPAGWRVIGAVWVVVGFGGLVYLSGPAA